MDDALGPGYDYWKSIKSPNELGMSDEGTIKALSNDISGLTIIFPSFLSKRLRFFSLLTILFTVAPVVLYVEQNFSLLLGTEILPETAMKDII